MIRFEQVSKAYLGGRQALQGVDFHLRPAEMAFLTGHSGAGKSTLLKLICGIERPSAGHILFGGHDISRLKNSEIPFLRRQIGMIFQDHHLLMDRTVYDNVAIPLVIAGASLEDIRHRVSAALDKVGLLDKARNFPVQLSGGETAAHRHCPHRGQQAGGIAGGRADGQLGRCAVRGHTAFV